MAKIGQRIGHKVGFAEDMFRADIYSKGSTKVADFYNDNTRILHGISILPLIQSIEVFDSPSTNFELPAILAGQSPWLRPTPSA